VSSSFLASVVHAEIINAIAATALFLSRNIIRKTTVFWVASSFAGVVGTPHAADQSKENIPSVEELVMTVRPSVVTIRHVGRGENDAGLGTGFIISSDGLIATNLHVIGEARPISVELRPSEEMIKPVPSPASFSPLPTWRMVTTDGRTVITSSSTEGIFSLD
jgi:S1-C subfamily serine protease